MRWGFTFVHYQRKLCALKMKNSPVARNQNNALPSYLLQILMVRTSYTHLLIHAALGENKNSWMTATLFQNGRNGLILACRNKEEKVCLLLDNCSAHKIEDNGLQCIELVLADQGIIKNFKHYYRRRMLQKIVLTIDYSR